MAPTRRPILHATYDSTPQHQERESACASARARACATERCYGISPRLRANANTQKTRAMPRLFIILLLISLFALNNGAANAQQCTTMTNPPGDAAWKTCLWRVNTPTSTSATSITFVMNSIDVALRDIADASETCRIAAESFLCTRYISRCDASGKSFQKTCMPVCNDYVTWCPTQVLQKLDAAFNMGGASLLPNFCSTDSFAACNCATRNFVTPCATAPLQNPSTPPLSSGASRVFFAASLNGACLYVYTCIVIALASLAIF